MTSEGFNMIANISLDPKDVVRQALAFDFQQTAEACKFLDALLSDVVCRQLLPAAFGGPFEWVLSFSVLYDRAEQPAAIMATANDKLYGMQVEVAEGWPITKPPKALTSEVP